jgi:hypothetical protein
MTWDACGSFHEDEVVLCAMFERKLHNPPRFKRSILLLVDKGLVKVLSFLCIKALFLLLKVRGYPGRPCSFAVDSALNIWLNSCFVLGNYKPSLGADHFAPDGLEEAACHGAVSVVHSYRACGLLQRTNRFKLISGLRSSCDVAQS